MIDAVIPAIEGGELAIGSTALPELPPPTTDPRGTFFPKLSSWLSRRWIDPELISQEAKKSDDADVPEHLWNMRVCEPLGIDLKQEEVQQAVRVLRSLLLDRLCWNAIRSFQMHMERHRKWKLWSSFAQHRFYYPWLLASSFGEF